MPPIIPPRPVAVFGAAGHTGRFAVAELRRRGFPVVAVGRDPTKLGAPEVGIIVRAAQVDDPATLDAAFSDAAVVVNCAGPFLDTAAPVAAAALRAGAHYLDVTAEQASATSSLQDLDGLARRAGLLVLPAMGFYGGLADLLATAAVGDWGTVDTIRIGIALDSWRPTLGTRITGQRNTVPRVVVSGGDLAPLSQPPGRTRWDFAPPFGSLEVGETPLSEVILIHHHLRSAEVRTFLNDAPLRDLRDPDTPPPVPADPSGRSDQRFLVEVVAEKGGRTRRAAARGRDIYASTAPLVAEAVARIMRGEVRNAGAHAPGSVFEPRDFLGALAPHLEFLA